MQQVLIIDMAAVTDTAAAARKLDLDRAGVLRDLGSHQHKLQPCKVSHEHMHGAMMLHRNIFSTLQKEI